jgi:hypothetical protein
VLLSGRLQAYDWLVSIGNLFPKPMLLDVNMLELGDERWQVIGE